MRSYDAKQAAYAISRLVTGSHVETVKKCYRHTVITDSFFGILQGSVGIPALADEASRHHQKNEDADEDQSPEAYLGTDRGAMGRSHCCRGCVGSLKALPGRTVRVVDDFLLVASSGSEADAIFRLKDEANAVRVVPLREVADHSISAVDHPGLALEQALLQTLELRSRFKWNNRIITLHAGPRFRQWCVSSPFLPSEPAPFSASWQKSDKNNWPISLQIGIRDAFIILLTLSQAGNTSCKFPPKWAYTQPGRTSWSSGGQLGTEASSLLSRVQIESWKCVLYVIRPEACENKLLKRQMGFPVHKFPPHRSCEPRELI